MEKEIVVCDSKDILAYLESLDPYIENWVRFRNKTNSLTEDELFNQFFENQGSIIVQQDGWTFSVKNNSFSIALFYDTIYQVFTLKINDETVKETADLWSIIWEWNNRVALTLYIGLIPQMRYVEPEHKHLYD